VVVKLIVDLGKTLFPISGRATQAVSVGLAIVLAVAGAALYTAGRPDYLEAAWLGVQAGAVAIGVDQLAKREV